VEGYFPVYFAGERGLQYRAFRYRYFAVVALQSPVEPARRGYDKRTFAGARYRHVGDGTFCQRQGAAERFYRTVRPAGGRDDEAAVAGRLDTGVGPRAFRYRNLAVIALQGSFEPAAFGYVHPDVVPRSD